MCTATFAIKNAQDVGFRMGQQQDGLLSAGNPFFGEWNVLPTLAVGALGSGGAACRGFAAPVVGRLCQSFSVDTVPSTGPSIFLLSSLLLARTKPPPLPFLRTFQLGGECQ